MLKITIIMARDTYNNNIKNRSNKRFDCDKSLNCWTQLIANK